MRKVTFGGANSLDNYFARLDHSVDWLMWTKEVAEITSKFWKSVDTILMGRKTYEVALKQSKGKSNPYPGLKSYVFSRTLKPGKDKSVEIVSEDAAGFVRKLKQEEGKDICLMGGGDFAKTLFEADLIDEIGFNIHPVLLGQGIPLFYEMSRQINLELIECRTLENGCVMVSYKVKHQNA
jgi:dihydrofolate reductase